MKKLFYLLFVLPFAVACGEPVGPTPEKEAILELTSDAVMNFDAEGGEGVITYDLQKGDEALDGTSGIIGQASPIVITTESDWITINKNESMYGTIKFDVAANNTTEERTGTITGKYTTKSFVVTINQAAGTDAPVIEGWAIVGSMTNNWDVASAITMEAIDGYFVARGVAVDTTDSFKFIKDGSMQNGLGGNGQAAERDYKYPASKYGSDIRVKEDGVYDLYINEALDTYYVMSEDKAPSEAYEVLAPGEDVWFVTGLGEELRLRNSGLYVAVTGVKIDEDGFKLRHSLTGSYGAAEDTTVDVGAEVAVVEESEYSFKVAVEEGKLYDIYFEISSNRLWVVSRGSKPDVLRTCNYAEGVWFTTKNFMLSLQADGLRITLDCDSAVNYDNAIIPAATYSVGGEDGNVINVEDCEIANEDGKNSIYSGYVTVTHLEEGYYIYVDVVTTKQHRIRAQYTGLVSSNPYMGGNVNNPGK